MQVQTEAFRGPGVVCFLRHLLWQIVGKLLVIWDGSPIHRAKVVKAFLAAGGAEHLWLEQLPGYAPELNPVEGIWHYLKRVRLGNVGCPQRGAAWGGPGNRRPSSQGPHVGEFATTLWLSSVALDAEVDSTTRIWTLSSKIDILGDQHTVI